MQSSSQIQIRSGTANKNYSKEIFDVPVVLLRKDIMYEFRKKWNTGGTR